MCRQYEPWLTVPVARSVCANFGAILQDDAKDRVGLKWGRLAPDKTMVFFSSNLFGGS